ncbi:MAG TPA: HEAT repeat domain-containing protein [Gemmataceae bacterium]|jgi:HEAT repeat protein|nr:HEAT repeat domain-containing protein [Gemmataceae bacterium]
MKQILFIILLIALIGCAKEPPKMAGAKWADALHDRDAKVRKKAAFTLGNIGPSDPAVLPALMEALKDTDEGVRYEAILALLKYGPGAEQAIPALTELRENDRDAGVRTAAGKALERIQGLSVSAVETSEPRSN